jgi:hypothetical protein
MNYKNLFKLNTYKIILKKSQFKNTKIKDKKTHENKSMIFLKIKITIKKLSDVAGFRA